MGYSNIAITLGLGVMFAGGIAGVTPASAQTPSAPDVGVSAGPNSKNDLTEIIVTARRSEERLQDVPISITVFNQEQLTNRNVTNASDLATYTPSLSANTNYGQENSSFAIRGFVQDANTPPSVGTYFADVVAPRGPPQSTQAGDGAGPGNFFDLQNVQVLKGPQGTLFGRNTTGGAVLFVPQKPTSEFGGYVEVSAGNYDMERLEAAVNLPINDRIRFRLAVDHQGRKGYVENTSGIGPSDYDDVDYTAVRGSLVVDLTANLENYTIASYSSSQTNGDVQKLIACNPTGYSPVNPATGLGNFIGVLSCSQLAAEPARGPGFYDVESGISDPESRIDQYQIINTTSWSPSDTLKVKNILSYARFRDYQRSPLFGTNWQVGETPTPYPFIFFQGVPNVFTGVFPAPGANTADQSTYTEEFQVQGSTADQRLSYTAGIYAEWSDPLAPVGDQSNQLAACTNLGALTCTDPIGAAFSAAISEELGFPVPVHVGAVNYEVGETWFRDQGLYAQSSYAITDQWKLTAGARYTRDTESSEVTRKSYSFPVLPPYTGGATGVCTDPTQAPSCFEKLNEKSEKPTWLLNLDYKPAEDILTYAKYARGYRSGGLAPNGPFDHRSYSPESVDNFELGLKSSFHDAVRGSFDVDLFYNNFKNQELQFGFNPSVNPVTGATAPVSPTTAIINAGKSRIYGAEIDTTLQPFPTMAGLDGLNFDFNYTYLDATIRQIAAVGTTDPNYTADVSAIAIGSPLVLSPKNKYSLTVNYALPVPVSMGRIVFSTVLTHTDSQLTTYTYQNPAIFAAYGSNLGLIPSSNLLNLNLNWNAIAGSPVDVSLFATNVTQDHYYGFVPGLATSGAEFAVLGQPRMWGGRVRYWFGRE